MHINTQTQEPISLRDIRKAHPDKSIGAKSDLTALGYALIEPAARPEPGEGEIVRKGDPEEYEPGKWRETWIVEQAPPPPVPQEVSKRQALLVLYDEGLTNDDVTLILEGVEDETARAKALIEWRHAGGIMRTAPLIQYVQDAQGWDDAKVDDLFRLAAGQ